MSYIINRHKTILNKNRERDVGDFHCYLPLLAYLEALPSTYVDEKDICKNLSLDGSLFQSTSATAKAFMNYGNKKCLAYLQSLSQRCPKAAPQSYPMDEDHIKLNIANRLHRFGLGQYFVREIERLLLRVYRNYNKASSTSNMNDLQFLKDTITFELLRTYGFKVSPLMNDLQS
ncbi:unnamed protein product [Lathyrus sativus]|nr:unnamed protein product [Lathyrus sativus]